MPAKSLHDLLFTIANESHSVKSDEAGRLIFQHYTRKQIAERLQVSERTLRRWLNEGTTPSAAHRAIIKAEGVKVTRRIKRKGGAVIGDTAVPAHRKMLKEWAWKKGKAYETGKLYPSDYLNYDVSRLSLNQIHATLVWVREHSGYAQIIYRIEHGAQRGQHASTKAMDIRDFNDDDLWEWINSCLVRYMDELGYDEDDDDDMTMATMAGHLPNRIMYIGSNPMAIPPTERRS